jgi:uncharacterized membrane protein
MRSDNDRFLEMRVWLLAEMRGRRESNGDGETGSIQRWRDRDHHNDHGAGAEGATWRRLERPGAAAPSVFSYVLSFVYVGIYWNNHHHLMNTCTAVTGAMLWANLHLLFWLSLLPFTTGWMGENHFTAVPTALYAAVLLMAAIAYVLLQQVIINTQGQDSLLKKAIGRDWKGKWSLVLYIVAIITALRFPWGAQAILVIAALAWLIPDRRIEKHLTASRTLVRANTAEHQAENREEDNKAKSELLAS